MPPIPGMRTSSSRQSALLGWRELKYSSAEANVFTTNPTELSNRLRPSRTDSSSSTIEMLMGGATYESDNNTAGIHYTFVYNTWHRLVGPALQGGRGRVPWGRQSLDPTGRRPVLITASWPARPAACRASSPDQPKSWLASCASRDRAEL